MRNISTNIAWLFSDKILRLCLTLFVTVFVARYLGPEQFGELNFVIALVSIFSVIAALGLQGTVVRDIVVSPDSAKSVLANAMVLRLAAAFSLYFILLLTIFLIRPEGDESRYYVAVFGTTLLFKCSDIYKYWFESQIQSKYTVWVENLVFFLVVVAKLLLVYIQAELLAFIWLLVLELFLTALLLRWIFRRVFINVASAWSYDLQVIKSLLRQSWPLVISAAAWILYSRIDQIMLAELVGDKEVGLYSAAVRLSEVSYFLPGIIVFSFMPAILPLLKMNIERYYFRLQQLFDLLFMLLFGFACLVTLLAPWFIPLTFGLEFQGSADILVIHVWCGIFSAFTLLSGRHLINIGMQKLLMQRNVFGLMLNVFLNYLLIPRYGGIGAAWASLGAIICSNYLFDFFHPLLRVMFFQKTKAMFFINIVPNVKEFIRLMSKRRKS